MNHVCIMHGIEPSKNNGTSAELVTSRVRMMSDVEASANDAAKFRRHFWSEMGGFTLPSTSKTI